jgi:hypothetical protein
MKKLAAILMLIAIPYIAGAQGFLKTIRPHRLIVQHAGSTGFLSAGAGYKSRNSRTSIDYLFGYVPEAYGGDLYQSTLKLSVLPIKINFSDRVTFFPLTCGTFLSYSHGGKFYLTLPVEKYGKGYYWWSSGLRVHIFTGQELTVYTSRLNSKRFIKSASLYYELNTNDLYIISAIRNPDFFTPARIISMGFGVRAGI